MKLETYFDGLRVPTLHVHFRLLDNEGELETVEMYHTDVHAEMPEEFDLTDTVEMVKNMGYTCEMRMSSRPQITITMPYDHYMDGPCNEEKILNSLPFEVTEEFED